MAEPTDPGGVTGQAFDLLGSLEALKSTDVSSMSNSILKSAAAAAGTGFTMGMREAAEATNLAQFVIDQYAQIPKYLVSDAAKEAARLQVQSMSDLAELKAADAFMKPQRDALIEGSMQFGKFTAGISNELQSFTKMTSDSVMGAEYGVNTLAQRATQRSYEIMKNVAQQQVVLADGSTRLVGLFDRPDEMFQRFSNALLKEFHLSKFAIEGINDDIMLSISEAQVRFGMTQDQTTEIMQRELSATGEVTGKFLDEQLKTALAASKISGLNAQQIMSDMTKMMSDFNTFGAMSIPQMASLSNTMAGLGLTIKEVTGLASKFTSFDSAIQTVNELSAVTGATMDTMSLFETAASGDIEGFVDNLRAQLEDAGVEFSDLNFIQQKAMARSLGVDPVILQRLMNDNIEAVESIADATTQAAGEMSKETRDSLIMGMGRIPVPDPAELYKMQAEFESISLERAQTIESVYKTTQDNIVATYDLSVGKINALGQQAEVISKIIRSLSDDLREARNQFQPLFETPARTGTAPTPVAPVPPVAIPATGAPAPVSPTATVTSPEAPVAAGAPPAAQEVLLNLKISAAEGVEKVLSWLNFEWENNDLFATSPSNVRVKVQTAGQ